MKPLNDRSLANDLAWLDLDDPAAMVGFVVDHTLAPVRAACGLPAPRPGEQDGFTWEPWDGVGPRQLRVYSLPQTPAIFDSVLRALLLFYWLFPASASPGANASTALSEPGWSVLDDWITLAHRPFEGIEDLVRGLFDLPPIHTGVYMGTGLHRPAANPEIRAELRAAQDLVLEALGPMPEDPSAVLVDIGLSRFDWGLAHRIDNFLRKSVHRRLVWFGTFEVIIDEARMAVTDETITLERGVFAADIPESLTGLALLDLTEQLAEARDTGICARCRRRILLTKRQAGRVRRGEPVYHRSCHDEERLAYFRDYQRRRYADVRRAGIPST